MEGSTAPWVWACPQGSCGCSSSWLCTTGAILPQTRPYTSECVEGMFCEGWRLVSCRRTRLGTLFEGLVHLLEAPLRVGLKAPGEQRNQQTIERFSLDESNTVLF